MDKLRLQSLKYFYLLASWQYKQKKQTNFASTKYLFDEPMIIYSTIKLNFFVEMTE